VSHWSNPKTYPRFQRGGYHFFGKYLWYENQDYFVILFALALPKDLSTLSAWGLFIRLLSKASFARIQIKRPANFGRSL
jgi:hypothetical protein